MYVNAIICGSYVNSDEVIHEGLGSDTSKPNDVRQGDINDIDAPSTNKGKHHVASSSTSY